MKKSMAIMMCMCLVLGSVALLTGCKEKSEPPAETETMMDQMEKSADTMVNEAKEVVEKANEAIAEQTLCPVMKNPINKDVFVEYKGKKVYFCCPDCMAKFEADPEKYIKDLPQFN